MAGTARSTGAADSGMCDHIRSHDHVWSERGSPPKEVGESDALPIERCPSPPVSRLNAGNRLAADARDFRLYPPLPQGFVRAHSHL